MRVLGIIPARYASSRFPGKPLIDLKGKSMIQRVVEGCSKSALINKLVVATDDQRIYDHVVAFGGNVMMTNTNHPSGTDRCAEIANLEVDFDVVINIQGDEPLIDHKQIDGLLSLFKQNPKVQIGTLAIPHLPETPNNPNRIKMVCNKEMQAMYFSRSSIPNTDRTGGELGDLTFYRHIGLYAYQRQTLLNLSKLEPCPLEKIESLEQLRWLYHGYPIHVVETNIETPNIDVPEDVEKVLKHL